MDSSRPNRRIRDEKHRMPAYYRHFKGGIYQLLSSCTHTESGEKLYIYRSLEGEQFARPASMWDEEPEAADGEERFTFLAHTEDDLIRKLYQELKQKEEAIDKGLDEFKRVVNDGKNRQIAALQEELTAVREAEEVASGIIARGKDALVAAGVLEVVEDEVRPFSGVPNVDGEPTDENN